MRKNKIYRLTKDREPVAFEIKSSHRQRSPLLYNDPETGTVRELRYATNMATPFVDEQDGKGTPTLGHIWFRDGILPVNENQIALEKFLQVHPDNVANGGKEFFEYNPQQDAEDEIQNLEDAASAMAIAKDLDIEDASAVVFNNVGAAINNYSSAEIRRDLLNYAFTNPGGLLAAMEDENVKLAWITHQAVKFGVLNINGNFVTLGTSKKKLLQIKDTETQDEAINKFFLTDDGVAALEEVKKKLKKFLS